MEEGYRFPVRPVPFAGESLLGYLKRLTHKVLMPRLSSVADILGLPRDLRKLPTFDDLQSAVQVLGLPQDAVQGFGLWRSKDGEVVFKDWSLPRHFLRIDHMRFCPECLAEAAYHRTTWNFAFVNHCPKHGLRLLDGCQHCGHKVSWNTPGVSNCAECGARFDQMASQASPPQHIPAVSSLLNALESDACSLDADASLREMPFAHFIELVTVLGRMEAERNGYETGQGRPLTWSHVDEVLAYGVAASKNLEEALEDLVRWKLQQTGGSMSGVKVALGSFYRPLLSLTKLSLPDAIHAFVIETIADLRDAPRGPKKKGTAAFIQLRRAIGLARTNFENLKKSELWQKSGIDVCGPSGGDVLLELKYRLGSVCTLKEAGVLLGIPGKKQLKQIADGGIFSRVPTELQLDTRSRYVFRSEIDRLLTSLRAAAQNGCRSGRIVGWQELRLMGRERDLSLPELLSVLLKGDLQPVVAKDAPGLQAFLFNRQSAVAALDQVKLGKVGSLSVREVADKLMVTPRVVYSLVRSGRLCFTRQNCLTEKRVALSEIERFTSEYASLNEIADQVGSSARTVRPAFTGRNTIGFEKDGIQFCRRSELKSAVGGR